MRIVFLALLLVFANTDVLGQQRDDAASSGQASDAAANLSVILENGTIYDGSGEEPYRADVGLRADSVAAIGDLSGRRAERRIDAGGLAVAPGFIDIHSHGANDLLESPAAENYVRQGVTTVIGGQDGGSPYPLGEYMERLENDPGAINAGFFVGHNSIRARVVGAEDRAPTPDELEQMQSMVAAAMEDGAFGLSSGLEYTPGMYAETEELVALARTAASYDGMYISHVRDEGGRLLESVREVIRIAEEGGLPGQVTHHKVVGPNRWGRSEESLALIDEARERGVDVSSDVYPYTASSTGLTILFPDWSREGGREDFLERLENPASRSRIKAAVIEHINAERGGDPSTIEMASCRWDTSLNGLSLAEILERKERPVTVPASAELAMELVARGGCSVVLHSMSEEDVRRIMQHPMTMIGSDGGIPDFGEGMPHPRNYGSFARVLGHYVREEGVLRLPEAIRKMSGLTAWRLGLEDRGRLRKGAAADVVVFDPATIVDHATFEDPHQYASGMRHVFVNGEAVMIDGELTGARPGRVIRPKRPPVGTSVGSSVGQTNKDKMIMDKSERAVDQLVELHNRYRVDAFNAREFSSDELWDVLGPIVSGSEALNGEEIGRSARGRPLRLITYGEGPVEVLLWSQMHGDESTATMALVDIFHSLAEDPDHALARQLSERLTVRVIPMLNPDGAEHFQRRSAQGIDINRDALHLATPEARALKEMQERYEPRFGFNLHDQDVRTRVGESNRTAAIALLAPSFNEAQDDNAVRTRAKQLSAVMRRAMDPLVSGHMSRYEADFYPRAFGDNMQKWGVSTVLLESGGRRDDPEKQYLRKVNFVGLLAALASIADGSYEQADVSDYTSLPRNGDEMNDLLITGGTVVVPDMPPYRADIAINYEKPLEQRSAHIEDVGDLREAVARDTLDAANLYLFPQGKLLENSRSELALSDGSPALFILRRSNDASGEAVWILDGDRPRRADGQKFK